MRLEPLYSARAATPQPLAQRRRGRGTSTIVDSALRWLNHWAFGLPLSPGDSPELDSAGRSDI